MRSVPAALLAGCLAAIPAGAEPFHGTLDEEVEAFLGSYVYVHWGAGAPTEKIREARQRCTQVRVQAEAPAPFRGGDIAVYRHNGEVRIEGDRVNGGHDTLTFSNEVSDAVDNFTFTGSHNRGAVELAHFHRDEGIWPGVWIKANGRLNGVYATCEAVVTRPVED